MHMTNWSYYGKKMEQEWLHWKSCEAVMMINGPFTKFDCCVKKSNDQTWEDFNLCMGILGEELMFPLRKYIWESNVCFALCSRY